MVACEASVLRGEVAACTGEAESRWILLSCLAAHKFVLQPIAILDGGG